MRVFVLSVAAAVIVAGASYATLTQFQESSARAYSTEAARLDWQEQSNFYGFEAPRPKGESK